MLISQLCVGGVALAQQPDAPVQPPPADQPAVAPVPDATVAPAAQPETVAPERTKKKSATEEITVTGSRIRRKDLTTAAPITIISREAFQESGKVSLGDFLQTLPEQSNSTNTQINNAGEGATRISLRGLNPHDTLVLVNGRRWVPGGLGANDSVDIDTIPTAAIDHVEILKDGASAVYGSDAIAGVVNIITKKHFNGGEVNAYLGTSQRGDGTQYNVDATVGTAGDKGSILFSLGYFGQKGVLSGARGYSNTLLNFDASPGGRGQFGVGSGTIPAGRSVGFLDPSGNLAVGKIGSPLYNNLFGAYGNPDGTVGSLIYDPSSPLGWRPYKGSSLKKDGFNFSPYNYLTTPGDRLQMFGTGDYKLGDSSRAYFEGSLVQKSTNQQLAPEPLLLDGQANGPVAVSKDNIYNPFGVDVLMRRRLLEFGDRAFTQTGTTYRIVAGLDGTLPESWGPLQGWFWDLSLNYGNSSGTNTNYGDLDSSRIANAVGPSFIDPKLGPQCGKPGAVIAGCVPLDLFHGGNPGSITPDQAKYLTFTGISTAFNELTSLQFNTSGELFKIASPRPVGLALGYEYRFQEGASIPDPLTVEGNNSDTFTLPTIGHYYSNEAYAELSIPVIAELPGIDDLEFTAAARFSDYSTFGTSLTYKFGGIYRPVAGISLRGTYSTAFRAPSVADLFTGQAFSAENVSDPCSGVNGAPPASCGKYANNGDSSAQITGIVGGNPKLTPEKAVIGTAGLVFEPGILTGVSAIKRLSLTLDYYNINIQNTVSTFGGNTILPGCYPQTGAGSKIYCDLITRNPVTGTITRFLDLNQNVGALATSGLDGAINYQLPTPAGRFGFVLDVNYLLKLDQTISGGVVIHGRNTFDLNAGGILGVNTALRGLLGINWNLGGLQAGLIGHYVGSITECGDGSLGPGTFTGPGLCYLDSTYQRKVAAYTKWDLSVGYSFNNPAGKTSLRVGVNNILDTNPPYIGNAFEANTDPGNYDLLGRFGYIRLTQSF